MTLVSLPLAIMSKTLNEKRRERQAVEAIEQLNGWVAYDWHLHNAHAKALSDVRGPPGPSWLRAGLGEDFFAHLAIVGCESDRLKTDADITFLQSVPNLVDLRLTHAQLTRSGFQRIVGLPLQKLLLTRVVASSDCWKQLAALTSLRELQVRSCSIIDADLSHLANLTSLEYLSISNTDVTPKAVAQLRLKLPRCEITYTRRNQRHGSAR